MIDHRRALADIETIRSQIVASTTFRGLGPTTLAATGAIALAVTALQLLAPERVASDPFAFFVGWIAAALLCAALIGAEMLVRSRRHHSGMADAMIRNAVQQFLPAGFAGAALAAIIGRFAPDQVWMLPALWQILVGVGLFSAAASLPRGAVFVAAWYFVAGCAVLMLTAGRPDLSPWSMGLPFAVGQFALAIVVLRAPGERDDR